MRVSLLVIILIGLSAPAGAEPLRTGKGPCASASDCRSGLCLAVGSESYCSKSCGDCPAGMGCDTQLFAHLGMKVCRSNAEAPVEAPPRLPCGSDDDCEGALVCAEMFGHRECTLPCRTNQQCTPPLLGGIRIDMMSCRVDQVDRSRKACLPKEKCLANPMACVSSRDGTTGLGGMAEMGRGMERAAEQMADEVERADDHGENAEVHVETRQGEFRAETRRGRGRSPRPGPVAAMSEAAFLRFMTQLEDAPFEDDRKALLRLTAKRHHFSCAQLGQIIDALDFEDERMFATRTLAPRLVDPENAHEVLSHFKFSDERTEAARILER